MERASNRFGIFALHALIWTLPFGLYFGVLALTRFSAVFREGGYFVFEQPSEGQAFYFQLAVTMIAFFYAGLCWIGGQLRLPRYGTLALAVLYGLSALFSSLGARSPSFTAKETAFLWSGILLLTLILHLRLTQRQVHGLLVSGVLVAGLCSLYGILQYLGLDIRWESFGYAEEAKVGKLHVPSTVGHPNYLTPFIGPMLMVCPGLVAASSRAWQKWALSATAMVIALCILLAGSRSAWLATLLVGGGLLALFGWRWRPALPKRAVMAAVIVASCLFLFFVIPNSLAPRRYSFTARLLSARPVEGRLYFYVAASRMIADRPLLGIGYNNYGVQFWEYTADLLDPEKNPQNGVFSYILEDMGGVRADQAHNEFLQIAAEMGVVGLATFLLLVVVFLQQLYKGLQRLEHLHQRLVLAGLGGAVVFILIDCMFSFPLRLPVSSLAFWLTLGLGSRYALPEPTGPATGVIPKPKVGGKK